jgi:hypothetical protein
MAWYIVFHAATSMLMSLVLRSRCTACP